MSQRKILFATAQVVLASAIADDGTFTVDYPSGTSQLSFNAGLAGSGHYAIFNGNDKWEAGDPGITVAFGASNITITNKTGASIPAGTKIDLHFDRVDGNGRIPVTIPLPPLAGITEADIVTEMRLGLDGYIDYVEFVTTVAVTTGSKAADLVLDIGDTELTGGLIALTSAAVTPKGKAIACSAITANNRITKESVVTVRAESVTAFSEGEGFLIVHVRPDYEDAY